MGNTHPKVFGHALQLANSFGFLYVGELALIQALAASLPEDSVAVQLGAGVGTGSLGMVEMKPSLRVYTVDISTGGPFGGMENEVNAFQGTGLHLPFQILGDSQTIWKDWEEIGHGHGIDLLFIDADHSESGLQRDIDGWLQFVNIGGYVLFHDYNSVNWNAITKVIDQNMDSSHWTKVLLVDTMIAFRRISKDNAFEVIVDDKVITVTGPVTDLRIEKSIGKTVATRRGRK